MTEQLTIDAALTPQETDHEPRKQRRTHCEPALPGQSQSGGRYGDPIDTKRVGKHLIAHMPWPHPCAECRAAASTELDGRRLCRPCLREALR
jgi:hypothetical protein